MEMKKRNSKSKIKYYKIDRIKIFFSKQNISFLSANMKYHDAYALYVCKKKKIRYKSPKF